MKRKKKKDVHNGITGDVKEKEAGKNLLENNGWKLPKLAGKHSSAHPEV